MADEDGPEVAGTFYEEIFNDLPVRSDSAAYALHYALKKLRMRRVPPSRWATFIHIGA